MWCNWEHTSFGMMSRGSNPTFATNTPLSYNGSTNGFEPLNRGSNP